MKTKAWLSKTSRKKQKLFKEEGYSNTILPQETRKVSNKQPNLVPKAIRKKRKNKTPSQQKERNHKDQGRNKQRLER